MLLWEGKYRQTPATGSVGRRRNLSRSSQEVLRELGNAIGRLERETDEAVILHYKHELQSVGLTLCVWGACWGWPSLKHSLPPHTAVNSEERTDFA